MSLVGKFDFGKDGFVVCRTGPGYCPSPKSDTNSMRAEINSMPDANSLPAADEAWEYDVTFPMELEMSGEVLMTGEMLRGLGCWENRKLPEPLEIVPWKQDPVSLADIKIFNTDLELLNTPIPSELLGSTKGSENVGSNTQKPFFIRNSNFSIPDSSESAPGLTEGSSRYSESIIPLDHRSSYDEEFNYMDGPSEYFMNMRPEPHQAYEILHDLNHAAAAKGSPTWRDLSLINDSDPPLPIVAHSPAPPGSTASERYGQIDLDVLDHEGTLDSEDINSEVESAWMSDYSEGVPMLEDEHPFLLAKAEAVRKALLAFEQRLPRYQDVQESPHGVSDNDTTGNAGSPPVSGGSSEGATESTTHSSSSKKSRQKRGSGNSNGNDGNDDDENGPPKKRSRVIKRNAAHQPSLACPFAKKDPITYRNCYSYILRRTQDVKQHLSRYHQLPIYCPRCKDQFDTETERDEHATSTNCLVRTNISYEGVTRVQKEQLSRRVSPSMTLEDQWFTIFDILFPQFTPRPASPYVHPSLSEDLEVFQDMMRVEGPTIILEALRANNIRLSSINNEEHDLSTFLLLVIAGGLQEISQRWMAVVLARQESPGHHHHRGDVSTTSEGYHANESTTQFGSSSDTLVENSTGRARTQSHPEPLRDSAIPVSSSEDGTEQRSSGTSVTTISLRQLDSYLAASNSMVETSLNTSTHMQTSEVLPLAQTGDTFEVYDTSDRHREGENGSDENGSSRTTTTLPVPSSQIAATNRQISSQEFGSSAEFDEPFAVKDYSDFLLQDFETMHPEGF
ncbi:hypothetical protein BX600DRAFT_513397 [Xylariales sp. PMI_506]|nr:hypothetical protein BX600DRAFT_513397 [Xylariales sp. PMI_506]